MNKKNKSSDKQQNGNDFIADARKRFITLTRDDLVKSKSDLPISEISIHDFKSSSMTREEIHKAELINFKDGEEMKELKNRYRVW